MKAPDLWERFRFRGDDIRGKRFNKLVVVDMSHMHYNPGGTRVPFWICRCDCGKLKAVNNSSLRVGTIKSCGCWHKVAVGLRSFRHGMSVKGKQHAIYGSWSSMLSRCRNPNDPSWGNYGGRGITVCDRWLEFTNFRDDLLPSWQRGLSLDRIDNNGGYHPGNCRWATDEQQNTNRRTTRWVTINGRTETVKKWCKIFDLNYNGVQSRLWWKWDPVLALTTPFQKRSKSA